MLVASESNRDGVVRWTLCRMVYIVRLRPCAICIYGDWSEQNEGDWKGEHVLGFRLLILQEHVLAEVTISYTSTSYNQDLYSYRHGDTLEHVFILH